ncbi:glycoside hydrolase family 3 protein [Cohnella pontilimi]|uniref:beta-N-acetylhexosaminidase n=1 Tax=Cohnella pontilimi TaxID=2564100 RepID=A0A4U0FBS5_9BACL|nr:glycoside hydrolase family 3 protein [Cohnella pontilimi]TJY42296.1 glycoside hydrolase family 3 protein [Cohnella pontilimi]
MKNLTLREKIGQLVVTGFQGPDITDELKDLVSEYKIGNIILFTRNVIHKEQLKSVCGELQRLITGKTGLPPFISIDQEGGRVTRLSADAANVPGAMAVAATGEPENAYAAGRITARELQTLGINFNLAPVLDINNNKRNPVINVRSYGDTAETVQKFGLPMMKGLMDGGVLPCLKHFPGHGDTAVDSHLGLPVIEKSLEDLHKLELIPFRSAIEAGAESVMTTHILFPSIEKERVPATMSRTIITDVLKKELGFDGLVISDCLEMDAIRQYYGTAEGALGALKAGVHLVFISHTPSLVKEAVERIEQAVASGELSLETVDDAVEKVLKYKGKYGSLPAGDLSVVGCETHRIAINAISRDSICLLRGNLETVVRGAGDTIAVGCYPYRTDQASSEVNARLLLPAAMTEAFGIPHVMTAMNPDAEEIGRVMEQANGYRHVIVGLLNGMDNPGQLELVNRLTAGGHRVTAVAMGKPYDLGMLEGDICGLAAFEYTSLAINSVIGILGGASSPTGRIPVAWKD